MKLDRPTTPGTITNNIDFVSVTVVAEQESGIWSLGP